MGCLSPRSVSVPRELSEDLLERPLGAPGCSKELLSPCAVPRGARSRCSSPGSAPQEHSERLSELFLGAIRALERASVPQGV